MTKSSIPIQERCSKIEPIGIQTEIEDSKTDKFTLGQIYGHLNQTKLIRTASMFWPSLDLDLYSSVIGREAAISLIR